MQIMRRFAAGVAVSALAFTAFGGAALATPSGSDAQSDPSVGQPGNVAQSGDMGQSGKMAQPGDMGQSGMNSSGSSAGTDATDGTPDYSEVLAEYLARYFSVSASKKSVAPGEEIEFTVSDKDMKLIAGDAEFTLEVHSKVYKLGKFKKEEGKALVHKWTVPADMEAGTHKVIIPEAKGRLVATFEVVGKDGAVKADAKNAKKGGLAKTGADVAGFLAVSALLGAGAVAARRRLA